MEEGEVVIQRRRGKGVEDSDSMGQIDITTELIRESERWMVVL